MLIFTGGLTRARIKIFSKFVQSNDGRIFETNVLHLKKVPLDDSIDFIIVQNKRIRVGDLCKQLNCSSIGTKAKVVHCSWIENCMSQKLWTDTRPFEIQFDLDSEPSGVQATLCNHYNDHSY
jgi:hypothetical protein